ncbi:MAG: hypothetical protein P8Y51_02520 [Campylobacterales bacterium]
MQKKPPVHILINEEGEIIVNKEKFDRLGFTDNFYRVTFERNPQGKEAVLDVSLVSKE